METMQAWLDWVDHLALFYNLAVCARVLLTDLTFHV